MANINGWGRGGWGEGAWGTALPVDVTGQQITGGIGSLSVEGVANVSVTGVQSAMAPVGAQQISQYFNPFQQFVTSEIARQGQIMQNRLGANAIRAGAFGGGREGVQQAELQGRTLSEIGRAQAQGFNTALQAAQNQQRIGLSGGQLLGAVGAQQQRMAQQDINQLMAPGGVLRQLAQATLDAQRRTQLQQAYEPYQRLGFLSNIYAAGPKTQSQIEMATAPQTNPLAQSIGTGLGAFQAFTGVQGT